MSEFLSVSVSLAWGQGHGRAQADTSPQALPDQQRSCPCLSCDQLVSQRHISHLFVRAMAAAGLGLRKSGKSRAKSSTQSWSPNSGQAAEDQLASLVDVLVSEQGQQSSSSGLTSPKQNQQAGTLTQSASSLDQLQNGLVQYQPSGNDLEPPTTDALSQYQPAGNNETPLAGGRS